MSRRFEEESGANTDQCVYHRKNYSVYVSEFLVQENISPVLLRTTHSRDKLLLLNGVTANLS